MGITIGKVEAILDKVAGAAALMGNGGLLRKIPIAALVALVRVIIKVLPDGLTEDEYAEIGATAGRVAFKIVHG
jgi:hypothetical protein